MIAVARASSDVPGSRQAAVARRSRRDRRLTRPARRLSANEFRGRMRAGKGSAYEGGVRTPAIALVPGMTQAGTVNATPVISMDWTATILDLAGAKPLDQQRGVSLKPILSGGEIAKRPLFWHYPHYHPGGATPYSAVLEDHWRLVEFFEDNHVELYHLTDDPVEAKDLAATEAAKATELKAKLHAWREAMGAQLPTPNPDYDPASPLQAPKKKAAPEQ